MNLGLHGLAVPEAECRRAAVVLVSFEALRAILRLPEGVRVTASRPRDASWNEHSLVLRIEGDGLPWTYNGCTLPEVMPVYRRAECGDPGHADFLMFESIQVRR